LLRELWEVAETDDVIVAKWSAPGGGCDPTGAAVICVMWGCGVWDVGEESVAFHGYRLVGVAVEIAHKMRSNL